MELDPNRPVALLGHEATGARTHAVESAHVRGPPTTRPRETWTPRDPAMMALVGNGPRRDPVDSEPAAGTDIR